MFSIIATISDLGNLSLLLGKYPRDMERDLSLCRKHKVDYVFSPSTEEIYPKFASTYVSEEMVSDGLCGHARPTHFKGVTTICAKLFNLCRPTFVALGQKDAQQLVVLKRMIRDLHFPIEVIVGPTVREADGLAKSSRNSYIKAGVAQSSPHIRGNIPLAGLGSQRRYFD